MGGCGFGPCDNSREMGGAGCYLCDTISHLPQPKFKARDALVDDDALGLEPDEPAPATAPPLPVRHAPPPAKRRRPAKGPQTGSLL